LKFAGADTGKQLPYPYPSGMWSNGQPDNTNGDSSAQRSWVVENAVHFSSVIFKITEITKLKINF
jgi:hypothetical protein